MPSKRVIDYFFWLIFKFLIVYKSLMNLFDRALVYKLLLFVFCKKHFCRVEFFCCLKRRDNGIIHDVFVSNKLAQKVFERRSFLRFIGRHVSVNERKQFRRAHGIKCWNVLDVVRLHELDWFKYWNDVSIVVEELLFIDLFLFFFFFFFNKFVLALWLYFFLKCVCVCVSHKNI